MSTKEQNKKGPEKDQNLGEKEIDQKEEELCRSIWDFEIITAAFNDKRFIPISSEI